MNITEIINHKDIHPGLQTENIITAETTFLSPRERRSYFEHWVKDKISQKNTVLLQIAEENITGYAALTYLDMASGIFGFNVWQIEWISSEQAIPTLKIIKQIKLYLKKKKATLIIAKIAAKNLDIIHALENTGFHFYEGNQLYYVNRFSKIANPDKLPAYINVHEGLTGLDDQIKKLTYSMFTHGHYFLDTRIPDDRVKEFVAELMLSYYRSTPERFILFLKDSLLLGFSFLKDLKSINRVSHLKFDQLEYTVFNCENRDRLASITIFNEMIDFFNRTRQGPVISEIAISNQSSWKFLTKIGAKVVDTFYIFHCWLDK